MSARRFRPKTTTDAPFPHDPEEYLKVRGVEPRSWGSTYGQLFERIFKVATKTAGLVDYTQDQINALRAINKLVLDYIVDLAVWVERQGEEPDLKPVAKQLASYLKQARDFELQYSFEARNLVDFVRYHCTTYLFHLQKLQRLADKAHSLTSKKKCVAKVRVTLEVELPASPKKVKDYLNEHGCRMLFDVDAPSKITSVSVVEDPQSKKPRKIKKRKVIKKPKKRKRKKK